MALNRMASPRYLRSLLLGIVAASLLLGGVAVWQFGPSESSDLVRRRLDDWHILGPKTRLLREARKLERANPMPDVQKALRVGNTKLLGVACPGLEVPGTDPDTRARLGVQVVLRGSVEWPEFEQYRRATLHYAERYNRAMSQAASR